MSSDDPLDATVFVLKNGKTHGPFDIDTLLELIEQGDFEYDDVCLREGAAECERLQDILDWDREPGSRERPEKEDADDDSPEEEEEASPPRRPSPRAILYHGRPSILTRPGAIFCIVGGSIGGGWLYPISPWLTFGGVFLALCGMAWLGFLRFTSDYFVTSKRIESVTGILARSSNEVRIEDVRGINVTCRGFAGMLGIGTVDFFTGGDDPEVSFRNVWNAKRVKSLVRKLQDGES